DVLSERGIYPGLHENGARLRRSLGEGLAAQGETAQVLGDGPLAQVAFSAQPVTDQQSWLASDRARGRALMLALLRAGVFLNPMGTKLYLSLAHDAEATAEFARHFADALVATRNTRLGT
ncbi:MAG: aspartate aminotransferase family protein, partial [Verrucomicrobia subdivision 3 bacterium]|nr:aspartate aminotransferase family protein [Limisphaerales bacterium]